MNTPDTLGAIKTLVRPILPALKRLFAERKYALGILAGVVVFLYVAGWLLATIKIALWLLLGAAFIIGGLAAFFGFASSPHSTESTEQRANRVIAKNCGGAILFIALVLGCLPRASETTPTGAGESGDGTPEHEDTAVQPWTGETTATRSGASTESPPTTANVVSSVAPPTPSVPEPDTDRRGDSDTDVAPNDGRARGDATSAAPAGNQSQKATLPLGASEVEFADPRSPEIVTFKDLVNFPEDYIGKIKLQSVWFHGGLKRDVDHNLFGVEVSSQDGKYAYRLLSGKDLSFVVSEEFGRLLDVYFETNRKFMTNLYCELGEIGETPVATIYRIEALAVTGSVIRVFEDQSIVESLAKEYQSRCAAMLNIATALTNSVGVQLVLIPPGMFTMGAVGDGNTNEKPAHEVTLTKAFYLADREVTVAQFQQFIDDSECSAAEKPQAWLGFNKQYSPTPDCPVQSVNWFDAVLYCNWLSKRERRKPCYERTGEKMKIQGDQGQEQEYDHWHCDFAANGYRLPTEAEWEYAARAGGIGEFCYGNGEVLLPRYASFTGNAKDRTWPAGTRLANTWGLFDMHGNAHEWCWDWESSYGGKPARDPTGTESGRSRLLRGGAFTSKPWNVRSTNRFWHYPSDRHHTFGFRVARTCP